MDNKIGKKIYELRSAKMMTQSSLAGNEITRNMLSLIEKGKAIPSISTLQYLANRLSVPCGYLLANEEESKNYEKQMHIQNIIELIKNNEFELSRSIILNKFIENEIFDDEIYYFLIKCDFELAKESLYKGKLKNCYHYLNEIFENADNTIFNIETILNESNVFAYYLSNISKTLNLYAEEPKFNENFDMFCFFIYYSFNDKMPFPDGFIDTVFYKYILSIKQYQNMQLSEAINTLLNILNLNEELPTPFLYQIYCTLEGLYNKQGNENETNKYKANKLSVIESMLSDY